MDYLEYELMVKELLEYKLPVNNEVLLEWKFWLWKGLRYKMYESKIVDTLFL